MAVVQQSKKYDLGLHAGNIYRLKKAGYTDTRITNLSTKTVAGLIADIQLADYAQKGKKPIIDAACDSLRWMALQTLINDAYIATPLTTVYDITVSANSDLSWALRGAANFPSEANDHGYDLTDFQPTGA